MDGIRKEAVGLVVPIVLLALWYALSADSTSAFFPPLKIILKSTLNTWFVQHFESDLVYSMRSFAVGFATATVSGVGAGVVLGIWPRARRDSFAVIEFLRATPLAALVPVVFVLFGPGPGMEIVLIAIASCWPILINTSDGIRSVDPAMLEMATVYGLSPWQRLRAVTWPAAQPQLFAGIRVAIAIGIITTVIANMFASDHGVGHVVVEAYYGFDVTGTWGGLLVIGLSGVVANWTFGLIEYRSLAWYRGWRASDVDT